MADAKLTLLLLTQVITEKDLAAAFTEWDRRYREEPERFQSEAVRLLKETPETYGEACAPYLIQILGELKPEAMRTPSSTLEAKN